MYTEIDDDERDQIYNKEPSKCKGWFWTDIEECKKIAEKYDRRSQFSINNFPYYYVCKKNNWLDVFYGKNDSKPKNYWTYKKCMEESKKYKCRSEFWAKFYAYEINE